MLAEGGLAVWAAYARDRIVGTVSLVFPDKPNSSHRAEVVKLMVHREGRGRGSAVRCSRRPNAPPPRRA